MGFLEMMNPSHWGIFGVQLVDSLKNGLAFIESGEPAAVPFGIFFAFAITALAFKAMLGHRKTV